MKKRSFLRKPLAALLSLSMVLSMMPMSAFAAAAGDLTEGDGTGLSGNIDTDDTISLPIKILDYENDGMLFEYAESKEVKSAKDFGATWYENYTSRTTVGGTINSGNYWSDVSLALKTGTYANYLRATWAGNTTANWTGNRAGVVLADFSESSTYTTNQVRYMVVVFRSNVRSGNFTVGLNRANLNGAGTNGNYTGNIAVTTQNNTNWTYAVLDLKTGTLGSNWSKGAVYGVYVGLPIDASGEWMDIAHVAFFSNKNQATAFGEYALTDGSDRGDNRAFGLLRDSRTQSGSTNYAGVLDKTDTVEQLETYNSGTAVDFSTVTTLGYTLLGEFAASGIANVGLLESSLSDEGYPVYKKEVVTYLAGLLKHSLEIPERTSDGWKNYRYVKGTTSSIYGGTDLATALRSQINGTTGSYAAASKKDLVGTWAKVGGNIASYYDAAYFLLNSIFVGGSYNEVQDDYDYLVLSAATDKKTGDKTYVFDAGFTSDKTGATAVKYDTTNKTISNSDASYKMQFLFESDTSLVPTTLNPFLPVTDDNNTTGQTATTYYQDDGVINTVKKQTAQDTLYERDYNFALVSEGEFVYHADDELFFDFEGDDDVYLFINGELVLDIGSAHSIDGVRIELNDYVNAAKAGTLGSTARNKALSLEEGNSYSFKFYYMERHSYGSNMRINTNIRVTDPDMVTVKGAYQNGDEINYGGVVDKTEVVEYSFSLTNSGNSKLYYLTFTDDDIGVKLDPTSGLTVVPEANVCDVNGDTLEAQDLTAVISGPGYEPVTVTFENNNALMAFLTDLESAWTETEGTEETDTGSGLWVGSTVKIRGIGYKLTDDQIEAGSFKNVVHTTANVSESGKGTTLRGEDDYLVYVPSDPMYYEWAGHDLKVTKTKLITDVLAASKQEGNTLNGQVPNLTTSNVNKIELVTKAGNAYTYSNVTIDSSYDLTINYDTTGAHVFYVKVTYNSSKNTVIVPVLVNVTDVVDSVFVLDYGLSVDLTANNALLKEEIAKGTVTAPGRATNYGVVAIGSNGAYSPNEITFTSSNTVKGNDGTFAYANGAVTYTPSDFMDGVDKIQVAVNVYEKDITPSKITGTLDINNEVEMYKTISVLPATVVYYEDDFAAITYNGNGDNDTAENTITKIGSSSSYTQSNDQSENYGHDATYEASSNCEYSAGSLTKITIANDEATASFKFKGTGFELIGRTNAYDSASLVVTVKDENGKNVKVIPVITEYDNGADGGTEEIYQVPVIRVKDLTLGTYTVEISGIPARNYNELDANGVPVIIPSILYVDGLRIYQPMGAANENYSATENGAKFVEIRNQIVNGYIAAAEYDGSTLKVSTGTTTWTEKYLDEKYSAGVIYEGNEVSSVNEYLTQGPNNEVYMTGDSVETALVFYVTENDSDVHNLQIAAHAVDVGLFYGTTATGMNASVQYGVVQSDGSYGWKELTKVTSGTEQYYTIDYTACPKSGDRYQVAVKVEQVEETVPAMISFTSLKLNGLTLGNIGGEATDLCYIEGILSPYYPSEDTTAYNALNLDDVILCSTDNGYLAGDVDSDLVATTAVATTVDANAYVDFRSVHEQMKSTVIVTDETDEPDEGAPSAGKPAPDTDKNGKSNGKSDKDNAKSGKDNNKPSKNNGKGNKR